jgi:hypothetical protein
MEEEDEGVLAKKAKEATRVTNALKNAIGKQMDGGCRCKGACKQNCPCKYLGNHCSDQCSCGVKTACTCTLDGAPRFKDIPLRPREQALEGVSWSGHLDQVVSLHDYDVLDMFVTDWEAVDGVSHKGEPTDGTVYVVRLDLHTGKLIPPPVGNSGGSDLRGLHYDQLIYQVPCLASSCSSTSAFLRLLLLRAGPLIGGAPARRTSRSRPSSKS